MRCLGRNRTKGWSRCTHPGNRVLGMFCPQHRFQPLKLLLGLVGAPIGLLLAIWGVWLGVGSGHDMKGLREELEVLQLSLPDRFEQKYPLGYCLIGVARGKKINIPPRLNRSLEVDWDGMRLEEQTSTTVDFVIPRVRYVPRNTVISATIEVRTELGAHRLFLATPDFYGQIECIRTSPVGIAFIAGFSDDVKNRPSGTVLVEVEPKTQP